MAARVPCQGETGQRAEQVSLCDQAGQFTLLVDDWNLTDALFHQDTGERGDVLVLAGGDHRRAHDLSGDLRFVGGDLGTSAKEPAYSTPQADESFGVRMPHEIAERDDADDVTSSVYHGNCPDSLAPHKLPRSLQGFTEFDCEEIPAHDVGTGDITEFAPQHPIGSTFVDRVEFVFADIDESVHVA